MIGFELVRAVRRSDCDSKTVNAGVVYEVLNFFGAGVRTLRMAYFVFDARQSTEFAFDRNVVLMGVFYDFSRNLDILFVRKRGTVYHNRCEAPVYAGFAGVEVGTVVEVKNDRNVRTFFNRSLYEFYEVGVVGVGSRPLTYLKNNGRVFFFARFGNPLNDFHIIDVERAYGVTALISRFEHLFRID